MGSTALSCIFAFRVLAYDDPVDIAVTGVLQRAVGARECADRANIGIELQRSSEGEQQAP